jgi:hypothetical protein
MLKNCMFLVCSALIWAAVQLFTVPVVEASATAPASVRNIRYWGTNDYIRIIIDLDSEVQYETSQITGPDRILFDLSNARLNAESLNCTIAVKDELLKKIRMAQNQSEVVRVVLDLAAGADYVVSELQNPFRIIIDLPRRPGSMTGLNPQPNASKPLPDELGPMGPSRSASAAGRDTIVNATPAPVSAVIGNPKPQAHPLTVMDAPLRQPRPTSGALIQNIRYLPSNDHAQVIIDLDADAHCESVRVTGPDRVYFDLSNSRLSSDFQNQAAGVQDKLLRQVRIAQNQSDVVRVVLSIPETANYRVSKLQNPFRIVIDLYGSPGNPSPNVIDPRQDKRGPATISESVPASGQTDARIQPPPVKMNAGSTSEPGPDPKPQPSPGLLAEAIASPIEEPDLLASSLPSDIDGAQPPASTRGDVDASAPLPAISSFRKDESPSDVERLPLTISGMLSSGYYSSYTRGGGNGNHTVNFVPAGAAFDISGYYRTPDLLDYLVQPEINAGSQASDAGFIGGNGVRINITTLRRGAFPATFRYSNVQLKDAYFGSLTQISSYTMQNRNKDLGVTAGVRIAGLPTATLDWGGDSVQSRSFNTAIPEYNSRSNHLNLNCSDQRWGWDFQCFAGSQSQSSDLFTPQNEEANASLLRQKVTQLRGSARRSFLADSDLYIDAGSQDTENIVLDRPVDLTTRYASANLRMFQRRKWKASLRAGYSSNIAGLLLTQLVDRLGGNGSIAPDASILQPFHRSTSYFNFNGLTSVDLSRGLGLYGSVDRTAVFTAGEGNLDSKYFTTAGGATYSRTFRWGSLSGQYGRTFGSGSITGETGRVSGQNYIVTAQPGRPDGLLFDFSIHGTSQTVRSEIPAWEHSFASDMGVGIPVFGRFRARIGGGWQKSAFTNQGNEFRARGYTARLGLDHPRFQLNGSLNSNLGNSLQGYSQMLTGIGVESTFLGQLHLVPSDLRGVTVTLHLIPIRKLEFSALFTHSIQHLEGIVANDFQVFDVYATFHFRRLLLVAGYFNSTQIYSSNIAIYPETQRGRFYVRISRPVKLL